MRISLLPIDGLSTIIRVSYGKAGGYEKTETLPKSQAGQRAAPADLAGVDSVWRGIFCASGTAVV